MNSILLNAEVWMNLTNTDIKRLEILDNDLVRSIWKCAKHTSTPMMFLDLGIMQIKHIIMQRRLMYLFYLVNQEQESILYRCFLAQVNDSLPGDWFLHVKNDLSLLKIEMTFDHIRSFSKFTYKKYIQKKI